MDVIAVALISLLAVVLSGLVARVTGLPAPLAQIVLGVAVFYLNLRPVVLDPELFFLLFLPPLLFLDGWRIPNDALLRDASTILWLALGLVVFTVIGMGLFIHWLLPAMPLAVSFALAAVISPTDPIAVSAVAARTPIPQRLMHILQGEALLNDASGLVCMRFAVAAVLSGTFSLSGALGSFLWVASGGLAIGASVTWAVARAASWAASRFGDDGGDQILITLLIPFGVYLLAESFHFSGILAAVAAGVTMSATDVWQWRATTRLRRTAVWDMVQFAANGSIFVLLGEQIPALLAAAPQTVQHTPHQNPWWLALYVIVILLMLATLRFAWVWVTLRFMIFSARRRGSVVPRSDWRLVLATTLAGVRGAVTLAGVLTLPLVTAAGAAFPARDLSIFLAAGVIVLSLLMATFALPRTLRGLALPLDASPVVEEGRARAASAKAAVLAVESAEVKMAAGQVDGYRYSDAATKVVYLYRQRIDRYGDKVGESRPKGDSDNDIERGLLLVGLRAERQTLLEMGRDGIIDDLTLRKLTRELDLQEARYVG